MSATSTLHEQSAASATSICPDRGHLWAVVLAGGEGARLSPLTRRLYGEPRPKQFAILTGGKSLLCQTLDRVALLVPPERTVVVTLADHSAYVHRELAGHQDLHVLAQPSNRGTAAGVLLPAHWIHARDPRATLAVFPTDHFILEELAFMRHVSAAAAYAGAHREWMVLLGATATEAEPDYGWIEPGECIGSTAIGPLFRVREFREKPSPSAAERLLARGCLWNTFVFAATASALIDAGSRCLPLLHDRLVRLSVFAGTTFEPWALDQAYLLAPRADFSQAVLGSSLCCLAVAQMPPLTWCDLGTPDRVARSLATLGLPPRRPEARAG